MPFVRGTSMRGVALSAVAVATMGLAACSHVPFTGGKGPKTQAASDGTAAAIGVNGYLWRATLDTLAFMPLASADPYGGVVITDWYTNPEKPDERFKPDRDRHRKRHPDARAPASTFEHQGLIAPSDRSRSRRASERTRPLTGSPTPVKA
jgi:hypothetical protein